jgi:hypothetical protein
MMTHLKQSQRITRIRARMLLRCTPREMHNMIAQGLLELWWHRGQKVWYLDRRQVDALRRIAGPEAK